VLKTLLAQYLIPDTVLMRRRICFLNLLWSITYSVAAQEDDTCVSGTEGQRGSAQLQAKATPLISKSPALTQATIRSHDLLHTNATKMSAPHIVVVMVDDLGWSAVNFNLDPRQRAYHEASESSDNGYELPQTPAIDALARNGVVLKRHYAAKMCAPSRSSFMTGRFPSHNNQKNNKLYEPGGGPPIGMSTIAHLLKDQGYSTVHVGKWHLGMSSPDLLPSARGFDKSFAMLGGSAHHFTMVGGDKWRDCWMKDEVQDGPASDEWCVKWKVNDDEEGCTPYSEAPKDGSSNSKLGCKPYSQDRWMKFAQKAIDDHALNQPSNPMFLFLSLQNTHGPFQVPSEFLNMYDSSTWFYRRYANAMISAVDDAVNDLAVALQQHNMWDNTLLLFTSDNGGPRAHESNFPLRGSKGTDLEGGIRVASFVSGGYLPSSMRGRELDGLIHMCDWWATFGALAGHPSISGPGVTFPYVDGRSLHAESIPDRVKKADSMDMWPYISGVVDASPRTSIYVSGMVKKAGEHVGSLIDWPWKIIMGKQGVSEIPGPTTPNSTDADKLKPPSFAETGALEDWGLVTDEGEFLYTGQLRGRPPGLNSPLACTTSTKPACLFNVLEDEGEMFDLAEDPEHRTVVDRLVQELKDLNAGTFQSHSLPRRKRLSSSTGQDTHIWTPYYESLPEGAWTGVRVVGKELGESTDETTDIIFTPKRGKHGIVFHKRFSGGVDGLENKQGKKLGVKLGMRALLIDQEPFSMTLLSKKVSARKQYIITFKSVKSYVSCNKQCNGVDACQGWAFLEKSKPWDNACELYTTVRAEFKEALGWVSGLRSN